jgi:hypothetical protein
MRQTLADRALADCDHIRSYWLTDSCITERTAVNGTRWHEDP